MFHDSLGSVALWRQFPEQLSHLTGRTVIAYDRLGFGQSDARTDQLSANFIREEAEIYFPLVRAQLGIKRFVAFGHSVGGGMAVLTAATYPDSCIALITVSAQAFVEERTVRGLLDAKAMFQEPGQLERLAKYHGDKARWVLDAWLNTWLSDTFASWSLEPDLPRVACPVLAIHGEDDEYGSSRHPEIIGRYGRGRAEVRLLPGIGHMPHREDEAQVLNLVVAFLAQASVGCV
jgi:pimeloyl-ACP methyl ester carboxylesterase